jgi:plasmid stability protein
VYVANVTVSLPDDIYRRARIRAAEESTSVSGPVRRLLLGVGTEETEFERRRRLQDETLGSIKRFAAADRLTRDEVHGRFDGLICAAARRRAGSMSRSSPATPPS